MEYKEEWRGNAIFDDGSGEVFRDTDFHAYLRKNKVEVQEENDNEWFHITGPESRIKIHEFKENRGVLNSPDVISPYKLRKEQQEAVDRTIAYRNSHENGEFLWNAKPRFGKTLSAYDFCRRVQAVNVLIVRNRLAIANSWYSDYDGGEEVVKPENLRDGPTASRYKAAEGRYQEKDRDVMKIDTANNIAFMVYGLENQTKVNRLMPVRVMGYDYAMSEKNGRGKTNISQFCTIIALTKK